MDCNASNDLEQAKAMEGKERFNFSFSKVTQIWSAKPIREKKGEADLFSMMDRTMEDIKEKVELKLPDLPKKTAQKHCIHYQTWKEGNNWKTNFKI